MLTAAAIHGLGAALIPPFLIEDELTGGQLIPLIEHEFMSDRAYYLIYPEHKAENPALVAFREWIEAEVAHNDTASAAG